MQQRVSKSRLVVLSVRTDHAGLLLKLNVRKTDKMNNLPLHTIYDRNANSWSMLDEGHQSSHRPPWVCLLELALWWPLVWISFWAQYWSLLEEKLVKTLVL
jgi:hypothetical protein